MFDLFEKTTFGCSKLITEQYSTSFTLGIKTLDKSLRMPIYAIYGYVRYADEIVDTFHDFDKALLLNRFRNETFQAIAEGISLNPVLHSFQKTVRTYNISHDLIEAFLHSMEMDLGNTTYAADTYEEYIYGSAEVVGLMCLYVFCNGDQTRYEELRHGARKLGAAFQKVNFLRDMKSDFFERGRTYFPNVNFTGFNRNVKEEIEADIQKDFDEAYAAILKLPATSRQGVYLAYVYYLKLFQRIKQTSAKRIQEERVRVPDTIKLALLAKTLVKGQLNFL